MSIFDRFFFFHLTKNFGRILSLQVDHIGNELFSLDSLALFQNSREQDKNYQTQ